MYLLQSGHAIHIIVKMFLGTKYPEMLINPMKVICHSINSSTCI